MAKKTKDAARRKQARQERRSANRKAARKAQKQTPRLQIQDDMFIMPQDSRSISYLENFLASRSSHPDAMMLLSDDGASFDDEELDHDNVAIEAVPLERREDIQRQVDEAEREGKYPHVLFTGTDYIVSTNPYVGLGEDGNLEVEVDLDVMVRHRLSKEEMRSLLGQVAPKIREAASADGAALPLSVLRMNARGFIYALGRDCLDQTKFDECVQFVRKGNDPFGFGFFK